MKRFLTVFGLIALVLALNGCSMDAAGSPEQKYDVMYYLVTSSEWARIQTQAATYGDNPTEAQYNQLELWIINNTSPQAIALRDLTKGEVTDYFLQLTTVSREHINVIFQSVDSVGKTAFSLMAEEGYAVVFIDKL